MIKKFIKFMFILLSLIIFTSCDIVGMTPQQPDETKIEVSIKIDRLPNKTSYYENEELDFTGLVVKLYFDDESSETINDYEIINGPFCKCKNIKSVTSVNDEFGYWDVCCECACKL